MTDTMPLLLPDVPGRAHGIVSLAPPTVQCDGCAATYTGRTLAHVILGSGFHFNPRCEHDRRRLCRDCAKEAGWEVDLPHLRAYADAVRALPDAAQLAAAHEATRQRDTVREWVDARLVRYPASHVAVELGRLVDRWGPSIESET